MSRFVYTTGRSEPVGIVRSALGWAEVDGVHWLRVKEVTASVWPFGSGYEFHVAKSGHDVVTGVIDANLVRSLALVSSIVQTIGGV